MFIRFYFGSWGWGRSLVVSRWAAQHRGSPRMFPQVSGLGGHSRGTSRPSQVSPRFPAITLVWRAIGFYASLSGSSIPDRVPRTPNHKPNAYRNMLMTV